MSAPDWPKRQPTPINTARSGQQDVGGDAFWFTKTPRVVIKLARITRDSAITQVYVSLAELSLPGGICISTHAEIADTAGVSIRKVGSSLRTLSQAGIIRTEHRRSMNVYTLNGPADLPNEDALSKFAKGAETDTEDVHSAPNAPDSARNDTSRSAPNAHSVGTKRHVTRHETTSDSAPRADIRRSKTSKTVRDKRSPNGDTGSESKPTREPTRTYQVAEWYANRVGGVIPGKGAREWADAKRLAETGITDDELPALFDWLAAQTWVKSLSLGLMASKYNDWRSSAVIANTEKDLPYNHHKSGKLVF